MSQVAISGNASGTGTLTIASPNTNSNYTLTLPALTGTILTNKTAGTVLQVVSTTKTDTFSITTSSTNQDITGMSVSITPTSATSKILVFADIAGNGTAQSATARLVRDSTAIFTGNTASSRPLGSANWLDNVQFEVQVCTIIFLDSPATTSSTTYKLQIMGSGGIWYLNRSATDRDTSGYDPRLASSITVMEIAA